MNLKVLPLTKTTWTIKTITYKRERLESLDYPYQGNQTDSRVF